MLNVNELVFQRGEDGSLLSEEVTLETLPNKPTVKVKPLTRGKLMEVFQKSKSGSTQEKADADTEVILEGLVEPVLTAEQLKDIKPQFATAISMAILSVSLGISQDEVNKKTQEAIEAQEIDLKKN